MLLSFFFFLTWFSQTLYSSSLCDKHTYKWDSDLGRTLSKPCR